MLVKSSVFSCAPSVTCQQTAPSNIPVVHLWHALSKLVAGSLSIIPCRHVFPTCTQDAPERSKYRSRPRLTCMLMIDIDCHVSFDATGRSQASCAPSQAQKDVSTAGFAANVSMDFICPCSV